MGVLVLYNTLKKDKEKFEPIDPPFVKIYHCGITPYDYSHVGHLRSEVAVDILRRTLRFLGYIDIAISNFTDIDDKIIKKAIEEDKLEDWYEIPKRYIKYHLEQVRRLNNLPFYINPLVTEHINDIVEFVKDLLNKGYAYKSNSGIYFEVDKFNDYGKLSGIKEKKLWEQETEFLKDKKKSYDFALWKYRKEKEPYWKTEIGDGRPGWHIECSTMSSKYLGIQFDIHSGGQDLIFPHHENEIAQSESRFNVNPWVRYWIHIGMVTINKEKMSKSLGNIIPAKEFIDKYGEMESRFFLISTHYRDPLDINDESIRQAIESYRYISSTIKTLKNQIESLDRTFRLEDKYTEIWKKILGYEREFINYILDDIDTTNATSVLLEATRYINKEVIPSEKFTLYYSSLEFYNLVNRIYACWDNIFYGERKEEINTKLIELIVEIRNILRKEKRYDISDKIREELRRIGIDLMDYGDKTIYRFI